MKANWITANIALLLAAILFSSCEPTRKQEASPAFTLVSQVQSDFASYWYQGKAELTSYDLEQARYGEIHPGHAVLIFVTEDFSKRRQVKLDMPARAGDDAVSILKCNFTKKFMTGIYPYSMMASVFSPVKVEEYPHALKVSTSTQEWCGHTYLQLNATSKGYKVQANSYFESEGDQSFSLPKTWLEDEIWNYIRIKPEALPEGEISVIPGSFFTRLRHREPKAVSAIATLSDGGEGKEMWEYTLQYPEQQRSLSIRFKSTFPYEIEGWTETLSHRGRKLQTKATRKKRIQTAYWTQNGPNDRRFREELGL